MEHVTARLRWDDHGGNSYDCNTRRETFWADAGLMVQCVLTGRCGRAEGIEMKRKPPVPFSFCCSLLLCALSGCRKPGPLTRRDDPMGVSGEGIEKIQHIVFLIKENRTFDHYFGTFPGADGATSGRTSAGITVRLSHAPDETPWDLGHSWRDALIAMNNGKMNKFDLVESGDIDGFPDPSL